MFVLSSQTLIFVLVGKTNLVFDQIDIEILARYPESEMKDKYTKYSINKISIINSEVLIVLENSANITLNVFYSHGVE